MTRKPLRQLACRPPLFGACLSVPASCKACLLTKLVRACWASWHVEKRPGGPSRQVSLCWQAARHTARADQGQVREGAWRERGNKEEEEVARQFGGGIKNSYETRGAGRVQQFSQGKKGACTCGWRHLFCHPSEARAAEREGAGRGALAAHGCSLAQAAQRAAWAWHHGLARSPRAARPSRAGPLTPSSSGSASAAPPPACMQSSTRAPRRACPSAGSR